MGGESKSQQQTSQTNQPWAPAIPGLEALTGAVTNQIGNVGPSGADTSALNQLQNNANQGNPYASQIGGVANGLLGGGPDRTGMVNDAYNQYGAASSAGLNDYKSALSPYTSANYTDPMSNPGMQGLLNTIQNRTRDSVNSTFAGAGRDLSGMNIKTLASGMAEGLAAPLFNQYNQNVSTQRGAQDALYGAQSGTAQNQFNAGTGTAGILSGLDQTKFGNQQAGVGVANDANAAANYAPMQTLAIEAMRRGIPLESLGNIAGILGPIAGLGGTQQGTSSGTQQMSGAQQFGLIAGGLGSLFGGGRR